MTPVLLAARLGRSVVTAALVLFAVWTLVYQAALLFGLPSTATLLVAGAVGVGALVLGRRLGSGRPPLVAPLPSGAASLAVLGATVVATGLALAEQRTAALVLAVLAAVVALVLTVRKPAPTDAPSDSDSDTSSADDPAASTWLWPVGWAAALVSGVLASVIVRPDGDDAYFVNVSTWVAERGRFPLRDTMISPDLFPALGAHSPPTHSIEGLVGAIARVAGIEAGTAAYVLAAPAATALGVLVLTALVEEARIPTAPAALLASVTYLWTTGGTGYSFGSFFGVRIWQGKAMLVSLALPLVLLTGTRLVRHGSARTHLLFGAALVAAVGVSNTAVFLVPVLVAGIAVAALALRLPRGALRLGAWLAYPLAAGAVSLLAAPAAPSVGQRSAEGFAAASGASRVFDPLDTVPGDRGLLVATCLGIGLGALGIRNVVLRTATIGALAAAGVTLLPGLRDVLGELGLASVTWRLWWVVPVPLLLAGLVGAVTGRLAERPRPVVVAVAAGTAVAVGLLPLVGGTWVGSGDNRARLATPLTWKVPRGALAEARFIESISDPGDTVLAPWDASRVLSALTVDVQPVAARRFYLPTYAGTPAAHAGARDILQDFVDRATPKSNTLAEPLDLVSVDTACVGRSRGRAVDLLEANGFTRAGSNGTITCLRR